MMGGLGIRTASNAGVKVNARSQLVTRIHNAVKGSTIGLASQEVRDIIETALQSHMFVKREEPATCIFCSNPLAIEDMDAGFCPSCGRDLDNSSVSDDVDDIDGMEWDPDRPVHDEESASRLEELNVAIDLPERFEEILIEAGIEDDYTGIAALALAKVWESRRPLSKDDLDSSLSNLPEELKETLAKHNELILGFFNTLMREEERGDRTSPACEIKIFRDAEGDLVVDIEDPLLDIALEGGETPMAFGKGDSQFIVSAKVGLSWLLERHDNLKKAGEALLSLRRGFFEALNPEDAEKVLEDVPLHRKELAHQVGVHASTVGRWCGGKQPIFVETPHGAYSLSQFFSQAGGYRKKGSLTSKKTREIIQSLGDKEIIEIRNELVNRHGIQISDRMIRYYLKEIGDGDNEIIPQLITELRD